MVQTFLQKFQVFSEPQKSIKRVFLLISKIQKFNSGSYGPIISDLVDTKYVFFNLSTTEQNRDEATMALFVPPLDFSSADLFIRKEKQQRFHTSSNKDITGFAEYAYESHFWYKTALHHCPLLILVANEGYRIFTMFGHGWQTLQWDFSLLLL